MLDHDVRAFDKATTLIHVSYELFLLHKATSISLPTDVFARRSKGLYTDARAVPTQELSHFPEVFDPATEDYGTSNGHPDEWGLTAEEARRDAYTHQEFAKGNFFL